MSSIKKVGSRSQLVPNKTRFGNVAPGIQSDDVVIIAQFNPVAAQVTQGTSITTGVTINAVKGIITTLAATAGAAGATPNTFTVSNTSVAAGSFVTASIQDYAGTIATNGNPFVIVDNVLAGSFDIIISNAHGANALNGVLKINFEVKN